jgi:hypothetical protein
MAIVFGAVAVATSAGVRRQLLLSFTRQPDNFAELYFPSPSALPTSFTPGQPLPVEFGLTNDSASTQRYRYVVTARSATGHGTVERSGTLQVEANHAVLTAMRITLPTNTRSLSVRLVGQPVFVNLLLHQGAAHGH